ncbi:hypothetical protein V6Z12_D10G284900 [Gossypium hirsutum]
MVEEMGKDIVMRKSECPGKRSRLWSCEDMEEVFKYDKGIFQEPSTLNSLIALM